MNDTGKYVLLTYAVYIPVSVALAVWVGRTLFKHGRLFLLDSFHGQTELADSVNHLLLVGFYLINIGYVILALRFAAKAEDLREAVEATCYKVGMVMMILGGMHFFNLFVLSRFRRRALRQGCPPPIPPVGRVTAAE
ncbi:MAG TPA: hypothetical protein VMF06_20040 [Candidatus Limnocylindria bacterium]|jgi:hypothetical protein|nr:hypothetical protein [Candidatus Limnocylindria bacterium]